MSYKPKKLFKFAYASGGYDCYYMLGSSDLDDQGSLVRIKSDSDGAKIMREGAKKIGMSFSAILAESDSDIPEIRSVRAYSSNDYRVFYRDRSTGRREEIEFPESLAAAHRRYFISHGSLFAFEAMRKDLAGKPSELGRQGLKIATDFRISQMSSENLKNLSIANEQMLHAMSSDLKLASIPKDLLPIVSLCVDMDTFGYFSEKQAEKLFSKALADAKDETSLKEDIRKAFPRLPDPGPSKLAQTYLKASEESRKVFSESISKAGGIMESEFIKNNLNGLKKLDERLSNVGMSSGKNVIAALIRDDFIELLCESHNKDGEETDVGDFMEGLKKRDPECNALLDEFKRRLARKWNPHTARTIANNFNEIGKYFSQCGNLPLEKGRTLMAAAMDIYECRQYRKILTNIEKNGVREFAIKDMFDPNVSVDSGRITNQPFHSCDEKLCEKALHINAWLDAIAQTQTETTIRNYRSLVESPRKNLQIPCPLWFKGKNMELSLEDAALTPEGNAEIYSMIRKSVRENYKAVCYILNGFKPLPSGDIPDLKLVEAISEKLPKKNHSTLEEILEAGISGGRELADKSKKDMLKQDYEKFGAIAEKLADERRKRIGGGILGVNSVAVNVLMKIGQAYESIGY